MFDERRLGQILIEQVGLNEEAIEKVLQIQAEEGGLFGDILQKHDLVKEDDILRAVAAQLDLPYQMEIDPEKIPIELIKDIPINYAKQQCFVPLVATSDTLEIAIADPLDIETLDDIRMVSKREINPTIAPSSSIINAINNVYDRSLTETQDVIDDMKETEEFDEFDEVQDLLDTSDEAPIIRLVNMLFSRAVKERASDIHIEPFERELAVRYRVDGILYDIVKPPKQAQNSIISRIKIMADLNIAEKRLPQDGRIRIKMAGKDIDIRVSTVPTSHGERVVMRLLDRKSIMLDLEDLGFDKNTYKKMERLIANPHGIILVTGPTGSGKTTTLYASLSKINSPDINILTVEDPVEYQLHGIGQMQVNQKIELSFASGLRAFLRQDPDVIMVGEIRDLDTAQIAVQASLTGHLVLSTVHTNDSAGAVGRLMDMGIEPFLAASSLIGILAQRLIRTLCPECRQPYQPTPQELALIGVKPEDALNATVFRENGCPKCMNTGYTGRAGIYELMMVDDEIKQLILKKVDAGTIKKAAVAKGMTTLQLDGAQKVLKGQTTIAEVSRLTQEASEV